MCKNFPLFCWMFLKKNLVIVFFYLYKVIRMGLYFSLTLLVFSPRDLCIVNSLSGK